MTDKAIEVVLHIDGKSTKNVEWNHVPCMGSQLNFNGEELYIVRDAKWHLDIDEMPIMAELWLEDPTPRQVTNKSLV